MVDILFERNAYAPGRVNLMGDHTDYTNGNSLPMIIQYGTTCSFKATRDEEVIVVSDKYPQSLKLNLKRPVRESKSPLWVRMIATLFEFYNLDHGGELSITTNLPIGKGLSSSASFIISASLAVGGEELLRSPNELAFTSREIESLATGNQTGLLDQLSIALCKAGSALFISFDTLKCQDVELPRDLHIAVVDSEQQRTLAATKYGERRNECRLIEADIGPLNLASLDAINEIRDPILKKRAAHVISENQRTVALRNALLSNDVTLIREIVNESHKSLSQLYDCSTPQIDELVSRINRTPGVVGSRLTGGGFGGSVVVFCSSLTRLLESFSAAMPIKSNRTCSVSTVKRG